MPSELLWVGGVLVAAFGTLIFALRTPKPPADKIR
jgi:hypothetical protein